MANDVVAWTFPAGSYVADVRDITLVNNTVLSVTLSVTDALTQYRILNVKAVNCDDVARNIAIVKYSEAAKINVVKNLDSIARNAGSVLNWPNTNTGAVATTPSGIKPELLVSPAVLVVIFSAGGVSAGGSDDDGVVFEYLRMNRTQ